MRPTYLGLGPPRTGTTSIHKALQHHPQIEEATDKELVWFDHSNWVGTASHVKLYERNWTSSDPRVQARGEISPRYIYYPDRILSVYPDIKFFVTWRDPMDRLISHLQLHFHYTKTRDFPHWTAEEFSSYKQQYLDDMQDQIAKGDFETSDFIRWGRKNLITPWKKALGDDQLLIINFEDLHGESQASTFNRLFEFLGAEPMRIQNYKHVHGGYTEEITLSEDTLASLRDYYTKHQE